MKNMFKKAVASLVAVASLSVCTVTNFTNAAEEPTLSEPIIGEVIEESSTTTRSVSYELYDTTRVYRTYIDAPSSSAAIFDIYTNPNGGGLYVLFCPTKDPNKSSFGYYFDVTGNTPTQSFSIPAGSTYYIYVYSTSASQRNPVTGSIQITKTVA